MKPFVIRGSTLRLLFVISIISCIFIFFALIGYHVLAAEGTPVGVRVFADAMLLVILVFGITMLCKEIYAYFHKVTIDNGKITWSKPFSRKRTLTLEQLSFWGCVAYAPRSTMIFFCTMDTTVLTAYLQAHRKECEQIFGAKRMAQLNDSDAGQLQLAVGTYIRLHRSDSENLFILRYGNSKRAKSLVNVIGKDAMITGPWLIDTASSWE